MTAYSTIATARLPAWLLPALLLSAVAIADNGGLILPNSYRTPLSDLVYEQQSRWRAAPKDDFAWRKDKADLGSGGRLKMQLLPQYDYSERDDTATRNRFMNEDELARPKTNIFKYNF
jgi:hypothetical protein